jgi:hypothetical protein
MTTELAGLHARTVLHDAHPAFFVHVNQDTDSAGDSANSDTMVWAVVQATINKDRRVFAKIQFSQLATKAKRVEGLVESDVETVAGGWMKITPKVALNSGEYALMPIPKAANTFSAVVYDFTLDPEAPNANDAVLPAQ